MRGGLSVRDVAGLVAGGGGGAPGAFAESPGERAGSSQTHVDDLAGDGEVAGPGLSEVAVVSQRELGWEQLWEQARRLGPDPRFDGLSDDAVEVALHARAVEASVALARMFEVLAEFVVRGIWAEQGCRTPGAWLSWKLGIGASTAREWVRVAVRLRELPQVAERFAAGSLSYSKVRALTRIALPEMQEWLLEWADRSTAAELEHITRTLRGVQQARHAPYADPDADDDDGWEFGVRSRAGGLAELRVIGPAEDIYELEARTRRAAQQRTGHETAGADRSASAEADAVPEVAAESASAEADAVPEVAAESASAEAEERMPWPNSAQLARTLASAVIAGTADNAPDTTGLDRHTLVLHAPAAALADAVADDRPVECSGSVGMTDTAGSTPSRDPVPVRDATGRIRSLDRGVLRRLACEAGIVIAALDEQGQPLDVGRRRRQLSAALRRAVLLRDRQSCRFPGCASTRHLHVHHIRHWADGGPSVPSNLITLCGHHHRYLHTCHDRGRPYHIDLDPAGDHRFVREQTVIPHAGPTAATATAAAAAVSDRTARAANASAEAATTPSTGTGTGRDGPVGRPGPHAPIQWDGPGHYDLDLAIAVLQQHLDAVLPPTYLLAA